MDSATDVSFLVSSFDNERLSMLPLTLVVWSAVPGCETEAIAGIGPLTASPAEDWLYILYLHHPAHTLKCHCGKQVQR